MTSKRLTIALAMSQAILMAPDHARAERSEASSRRELVLGWVDYSKHELSGCRPRADLVAEYLKDEFKDKGITITLRPIKGYNIEPLTADDQISLAYFPPFTYVLANEKLARTPERKFRAIASYTYKGAVERFAVVVWKRSAGADISQVLGALRADRGKKLALVDPSSTSGYLWPSRWLLDNHINVIRGSEITTLLAGSHDLALQYLSSRDDVLAAATYDQMADAFWAQQRSPERRFARFSLTPPLPLDAFAIRANRQSYAGEIQAALAKMNTDPRIDRWRRCLDTWIPADDSYYDLVRAFVAITRPTPVLVLSSTCDPRVKQMLTDELQDWFSIRTADSESSAPSHDCREFVAQTHDGKLELDVGVIERLREEHPRGGYLIEDATAIDPERGVQVTLGDQRGIAPGMAAAIQRSVWNQLGTAADHVIHARVTAVTDRGEVFVRPVSDSWWNVLRQELDPGDRMIQSVQIQGYPQVSGGYPQVGGSPRLTVDVTDVAVTSDGHMDVEFVVRVVDKDGAALPADEWGWVIESTSHARGPGDTGETKLHIIPLGRSQFRDRASVSGASISSPVDFRLLGQKPYIQTKRFGVWDSVYVWGFVLIGAMFGTLLKWVALLTPAAFKLSKPDQLAKPVGICVLRFLALRLVELAAGVGVAMLLFMMFVTIKVKPFDALDPNAVVTRIAVGLTGGTLGAAGLGALVKRLVGMQS